MSVCPCGRRIELTGSPKVGDHLMSGVLGRCAQVPPTSTCRNESASYVMCVANGSSASLYEFRNPKGIVTIFIVSNGAVFLEILSFVTNFIFMELAL